MGVGDVIIRIVTDATGAVTGINAVNENLGTLSASAKNTSGSFDASAASLVKWGEGVITGAAAAAKMIDTVNDIGVASLRARAGLDAMTNGQADQYVEKMMTATRGLVDDTDLMTKATFALSTGVVRTSTDMAKLAEDGAALGRVFGGDAAGGIDSLTRALQMTGSTRAIRTLGIDATATMEEFTKLKSSMSDENAWKTAVMDQADATVKRLGESAYGTGTSLERMKIMGADAFESFSERASQGIEGVFTAMSAFYLYEGKMAGLNSVTHGQGDDIAGATNIQGAGPIVGTTGLRSNGALVPGQTSGFGLSAAQGYDRSGMMGAGSYSDSDISQMSAGANRDRNRSGMMTAQDLEPVLRTEEQIRESGIATMNAFSGQAKAARDVAIATENAAAAAKKEAEARQSMTAGQLLGAQSNTLAADLASGADSSVSAAHAALQKALDKKVGHGDSSGSGWAGGTSTAVDALNPKLAKAKAHYDDLAYSIAHAKHVTETQTLAFQQAGAALAKLQGTSAASGGSTGPYKVYTKDDEAKALAAADREAKQAKDAYMIATGQATAASIKESDVQADLNAKMAAGTLSVTDYYHELTKMYQTAQSGTMSLESLSKAQQAINLAAAPTKAKLSLVHSQRADQADAATDESAAGASVASDPYQAMAASQKKVIDGNAKLTTTFNDAGNAGTEAGGRVVGGMNPAAAAAANLNTQTAGALANLRAMASGRWTVTLDMTGNGAGAVNGSGFHPGAGGA